MANEERLTLREWRLRRLMSQDDLAVAAGVTQDTVTRLERGVSSARPSTLRKIVAALGITPEQLVSPASQSRLGRPPAERQRNDAAEDEGRRAA